MGSSAGSHILSDDAGCLPTLCGPPALFHWWRGNSCRKGPWRLYLNTNSPPPSRSTSSLHPTDCLSCSSCWSLSSSAPEACSETPHPPTHPPRSVPPVSAFSVPRSHLWAKVEDVGTASSFKMRDVIIISHLIDIYKKKIPWVPEGLVSSFLNSHCSLKWTFYFNCQEWILKINSTPLMNPSELALMNQLILGKKLIFRHISMLWTGTCAVVEAAVFKQQIIFEYLLSGQVQLIKV